MLRCEHPFSIQLQPQAPVADKEDEEEDPPLRGGHRWHHNLEAFN